MLGDRVSARKVNGGVIVTNRPVRKRGKPSAKLLAQRERFKEAVAYAKHQEKHEKSSALYAQGIKSKHQSVYSVALGDFMNAPIVKMIDPSFYHGRIGDIVEIEATDDFMVTKVIVTIIDAHDVVIEQGEATQHSDRINAWEYKSVEANATQRGTKIRAIAIDKPGNKGTKEIVL